MSSFEKADNQRQQERNSTGTPELLKSCQTKSSVGSSASTISLGRRSARLQEKEELIELNDRLAAYIENVRRLESENGQLKEIVQNYSQVQESELKQLRQMYDTELSEVRKMLDDASRERARLEINISRLRSTVDEKETKLKGKDAELYRMEEQVTRMERELADIKARNGAISAELERRTEELARQRSIAPELERQLNKVQKQLESETLLRIDCENRNLTLTEELEFVRQVSAQELDRVKQSAAEVANLSAKADKIEAEERALNDSLMRQHLQEIRQETEEKIDQMRMEIDSTYKRRLEDLEQQLSHAGSSAQAQRVELEQCRRRISELCTDRDHLNSKLAARDKALSETEAKSQRKQEQWEQRIALLESKLARAHQDYQSLNEDYHQLLDLKVTLDQEIETYRRLVESEEERLNIPSRKRRCVEAPAESVGSGSKLSVRFSSSAENSGPIAIIDEDAESGSFIAVKNISNNAVSLGGWVLSRYCSDAETGEESRTEHKFPRNTNLKPGEEIRVYSFDAEGAVHQPPHCFVMTKGKRWPVGECCVTKLIDFENSEVAQRETLSKECESDSGTDDNASSSASHKGKKDSGVASKLRSIFSYMS